MKYIELHLHRSYDEKCEGKRLLLDINSIYKMRERDDGTDEGGTDIEWIREKDMGNLRLGWYIVKEDYDYIKDLIKKNTERSTQ